MYQKSEQGIYAFFDYLFNEKLDCVHVQVQNCHLDLALLGTEKKETFTSIYDRKVLFVCHEK